MVALQGQQTVTPMSTKLSAATHYPSVTDEGLRIGLNKFVFLLSDALQTVHPICEEGVKHMKHE
jgi:hypothetical protein